jgi:2-polyprenyl-3-methyl-5-hydroxy-6-metoxy-1,4-benzoquinol methylase
VTARVDACPLCDDTAAREVVAVPYERIWAGLREEWGAELTEDVIAHHQVGKRATLVRCRTCGLEYFPGAVAGDHAFYEQLMGAMPYHGGRWEFDLVLPTLRPTDAVVDLGAGEGAFVRAARERVARAVGVDHNEDAISRLRADGIEAHVEDLASFTAREAGAFDVACSFHTIEHLAEVGPLVTALRDAVRPGGRVFVSTPDRRRLGRRDDEPLDCPPHHVSRWSPAQLRALAEGRGLRLRSVRSEEPAASHVWQVWRDRGRPVLDRLGARDDGDLLTKAWMHLATGPRRYALGVRRGAYRRRGWVGHAMLAELERPT